MLSDGFRIKESGLLRYETSDKGCGLIEVWFCCKLAEASDVANDFLKIILNSKEDDICAKLDRRRPFLYKPGRRRPFVYQ